MVIASWLIAVDPEQANAAQASLRRLGEPVANRKGSRWIVLLTESATGIEAVRRELLATPGVETASPVASFDDESPDLELARW
jgi:hypothetical protein